MIYIHTDFIFKKHLGKHLIDFMNSLGQGRRLEFLLRRLAFGSTTLPAPPPVVWLGSIGVCSWDLLYPRIT